MDPNEQSFPSSADTVFEVTIFIVAVLSCLVAQVASICLVAVSAWNGTSINWMLFVAVLSMYVGGVAKTALMICGFDQVLSERIEGCARSICVVAALSLSAWIYCFQASSITNLLVIALIGFPAIVSIAFNIWAWWKRPVKFRNIQGPHNR
ncbi:hypothetical protein [Stenotrophomonas sp. S39]|uniref:hypothetical protein n=1 Tax=Stenotrophomonas sp. S39 TaxID=2767451 RepID=UPI00190D079B|nr:hypothetical protein [Stenotrophomonas sp. S39]MBK0052973.1 hypothetical protein [Stenotrophomonas sp. S39]